jgi:phosphoglycolate phosphatase-like HAD superfamily hydrolase
MTGSESETGVTWERYDAVLFDQDGVLTDTAGIHAACWKRIRHDQKVQGSDRAHSTQILPWSYTIFRNLKTWLRGTFHEVSVKHLSRYLDEFLYRFDRRWREAELCGFVLDRTASARPLSYHRLGAEAAG